MIICLSHMINLITVTVTVMKHSKVRVVIMRTDQRTIGPVNAHLISGSRFH